MSDRRIAILLAALLAWPAAGLAEDMPGMDMHPARKAPADTAMMRGMVRMQHDMDAAPMTGDPDRDFVAMMIPHHQGAVSMAEVELKYGHDKTMMTLARDIVAAQKREIAQMHAWQAAHRAR